MLLGWTLLLAASIAAGGATCASLAAARRAVAASVATALIAGAGSVFGLVILWRDAARTDVLIAAAFIGVAAYLGGFALGAALLPALTRMPPLPPIGALPRTAGGGVAVVVLAEGEPEGYSASAVTATFERLTDTEVPVPPDAVRVFAYLSERLRYRSAGMSPARPVVRSLVSRVREGLSERGFDGPVREAWLLGTPRLADAVAEAASMGFPTVVVGGLDVAESVLYENARAEVGRIAPPASGVRVCYTPPLWSDARLSGFVARRALAALPRGPRATDGVVLVAEGQPWQWDRAWPNSCEHTTFFVQRVRSELVAAGMPTSNVRVAWLDWQDPGVTEVVRHLAALGCERIVIVPATSPADTLETILDLPVAVEQAALDPDLHVEILHGWGDDPEVAAVLTDAIAAAAKEAGCGIDQ